MTRVARKPPRLAPVTSGGPSTRVTVRGEGNGASEGKVGAFGTRTGRRGAPPPRRETALAGTARLGAEKGLAVVLVVPGSPVASSLCPTGTVEGLSPTLSGLTSSLPPVPTGTRPRATYGSPGASPRAPTSTGPPTTRAGFCRLTRRGRARVVSRPPGRAAGFHGASRTCDRAGPLGRNGLPTREGRGSRPL